MSNKDMPVEIYNTPAAQETSRLYHAAKADNAAKKQRRDDMKAFTMAALQGFCANPAIIDRASDQAAGYTAKAAVDFAEAALAELEKRNG